MVLYSGQPERERERKSGVTETDGKLCTRHVASQETKRATKTITKRLMGERVCKGDDREGP